jgi:hypothetical protein
MRKLQAYFESMCEARTAASALSEAGCGSAHLDLSGALDYEYSQEISNIDGYSPTEEGNDHFSALMMGLWASGLNDKRSLATAQGIVSPEQDDCEEGELKISTRLVLKVSDDAVEKAFSIISENGGRIFPSAMV